MLREQVRSFIKSGVDALNRSYGFNSGRVTEFNSARDNGYPFLWLESLSSDDTINQSTQGQFRRWNIVIHIADKDSNDSTAEQYEMIVDACDRLAQLLLKQLNIDLIYSDLITIENSTCEPFIHKQADNTSGVILSFQLVDYNSTDVC